MATVSFMAHLEVAAPTAAVGEVETRPPGGFPPSLPPLCKLRREVSGQWSPAGPGDVSGWRAVCQ